MPSKRCTRCKEDKDLEDYHRDRSKKDGRKTRCAECENACKRQAYDPKKRKNWDLIRRYGIDLTEYDAMEARQDGLCAICLAEPAETLNVDHCHDTGTIRGLLCGGCNVALGLLKEKPETIARAALYVARHQGPIPT